MKLRCRLGWHLWGGWITRTHAVPLYKFWAPHSSGRTYFVVGWEYTRCEMPSWRRCICCQAFEIKERDEH